MCILLCPMFYVVQKSYRSKLSIFMKKVALITGGSRGIGLGIAKHLAQNGFDLAVNGVREEKAVADALQELRNTGAAIFYCQGDVSLTDDRKNSWGLEKLKESSQLDLTIINSVLTRHGIPDELKYMAIVESNLNTDTVCNRTGATGLWQLMPVTARELGLKVTGDHDERLHIDKSSAAAAKYLQRLYAEFGDWLLAIAAYNSGPGKVTRAINLSGHKNFWQLEEFLPTETRNHVKRFMSVMYFFEAVVQQNVT